MRLLMFVGMLASAVLAIPILAHSQTDKPRAGGSDFAPAPVPAIPPPTPQTGQTTIPPERIAPPGTGTADSTDTSSPNTSPFSGPPSSLNPGTNQRSPGGGRVEPVTPNLSR